MHLMYRALPAQFVILTVTWRMYTHATTARILLRFAWLACSTTSAHIVKATTAMIVIRGTIAETSWDQRRLMEHD